MNLPFGLVAVWILGLHLAGACQEGWHNSLKCECCCCFLTSFLCPWPPTFSQACKRFNRLCQSDIGFWPVPSLSMKSDIQPLGAPFMLPSDAVCILRRVANASGLSGHALFNILLGSLCKCGRSTTLFCMRNGQPSRVCWQCTGAGVGGGLLKSAESTSHLMQVIIPHASWFQQVSCCLCVPIMATEGSHLQYIA